MAPPSFHPPMEKEANGQRSASTSSSSSNTKGQLRPANLFVQPNSSSTSTSLFGARQDSSEGSSATFGTKAGLFGTPQNNSDGTSFVFGTSTDSLSTSQTSTRGTPPVCGSSNSSEAEHLQPHEFITSPIVTVKVGTERRGYFVYKELICKYSDFFRKSLTDGSKEAETYEVILEDDDPKAFDLVVDWIYHQIMPKSLLSVFATASEMHVMIDGYILAEKLGMPEKCLNDIIDAIRNFLYNKWSASKRKAISVSTLRQLDEKNVPSSSKLRKFLTVRFAWEACATSAHYDGKTKKLESAYSDFLKGGGELVVDVMTEMIQRYKSQVKEDPAEVGVPCLWHVHTTTQQTGEDDSKQ